MCVCLSVSTLQPSTHVHLHCEHSKYPVLGVRIRSVCLARAHILLTFEPTRDITVSRRGTLTVGYVQGSVSSVSCCRRSCSACSLADLRGWSVFLKTAMRFLCFASRSSSLALSQSGLHRVVAAFGPFVVASVFAPVSYLFLPRSSHNSPPFLRRNNETARAATALDTINLRKCTQLFVNRIF